MSLLYLLGGYAACQIMVNNGNSIFGEVNIKLDKGGTLNEHNRYMTKRTKAEVMYWVNIYTQIYHLINLHAGQHF